MSARAVAGRPAPAAAELLTPEFQAQLRRLKDLFFRRRSLGELPGAGFGPTPEFDVHRSYEHGDDPRYIDWNVYARTERLLLKVFIPEDERQLCVFLDTSASMREGGGRKSLTAARFAAAYAYLALCSNRPLIAGAYAERFLASFGPWRGLRHLPECLDFFGRPPEGRASSFGRSLAEFVSARRERCFVVVVSDFFQEDDVREEIAWLRRRRHDLHLVQVLEDRELSPQLRGACTVVDVEGDGEVSLVAGNDFLQRLRAALREHVAAIGAACRREGASYALVRAAEPFEKSFLGTIAGHRGG